MQKVSLENFVSKFKNEIEKLFEMPVARQSEINRIVQTAKGKNPELDCAILASLFGSSKYGENCQILQTVPVI